MAWSSWTDRGNAAVSADGESHDPNAGYRTWEVPPKSRKRSSTSAGLQEDNLVAEFERRLKLTPSTTKRLNVADKIFQDPQFLSVLMKTLPEVCVRKLATTCSQFRSLAYKTLRKKKGNNAFSILWIDDEVLDSSRQQKEFDFRSFFHNAHLGDFANPSPPSPALVKSSQAEIQLETSEEKENKMSVDSGSVTCQDSSKRNLQLASVAKVNFILTYGSADMESDLPSSDESKSMQSAAFGTDALLVLSNSIVVTSPDGKQTVDSVLSANRKLMTSIMFPQCRHISFEWFVVPASLSLTSSPCFSTVVGALGSFVKPKALILYQYLNLIDSKPGIVEVLQGLKMTQGSSGFPMITGIYNNIDANINNTFNAKEKAIKDIIAGGILICGDDLCNVTVMSINLLTALNETVENNFIKIEDFFGASAFTTKFALLFYHDEVTRASSDGNLNFKFFIDSLQRRLPDVKLHGIGSLSGAHAMFVNPESDQCFNQLNERMMGLTGTVESKSSPDSLDVVLVLLAYKAD